MITMLLSTISLVAVVCLGAYLRSLSKPSIDHVSKFRSGVRDGEYNNDESEEDRPW